MLRGRSDGHDGNQAANGRAGTGTGTGGNLAELVRATADGLGELVVQHVKLAQLDLTANLRAAATRATVVAVCGVLMVVGYTLSLVGVGLLLGGGHAAGVPLLGIGVTHLVGAGVSMLVVVRRLRRTTSMSATTTAIGESARTLLASKSTALTKTDGTTAIPPRLEHSRVV